MNIEVSPEVLEEIEHILAALPGKVFYAEDGEALILADDGKYIISVMPNVTAFNKGNPGTASAYLITVPLADLVPVPTAYAEGLSELEGWTSGWDC